MIDLIGGVLALDEPTTNLDAANIRGLAEAHLDWTAGMQMSNLIPSTLQVKLVLDVARL